MAQLNKTTINGSLTIENLEDENKEKIALQLPEGSKIYVGDKIFTTDWEENGSGENTKPAIMQGQAPYGRVSSAIVQNDLKNNRAEGEFSHAEGCYASGQDSNSSFDNNGRGVVSKGEGSHAEGGGTFTGGKFSHAEGLFSEAYGDASHAEGAEYHLEIESIGIIGGLTSAFGQASHAEGAGTCAKADGAHSEGVVTVAGRFYEFNEDTKKGLIEAAKKLGLIEKNETLDKGKIAELAEKLMGYGAHSEGTATEALGSSSHAEGNLTKALANSTHSEGDSTVAWGEASHAEGCKTRATGNQSHAEGFQTMATGNASHAEGKESQANGYTAHAEGLNTRANGLASHSEGTETIAASQNQHAQGKFNIYQDNDEKPLNYAHIVGNGSSSTARSNAHTLDWNGNAWYQGSMTSNGADYSEFFEWQDGNADNEDRVGLLVALDGEKIRLANSGDEILGIISGTAAVLGDNYECEWNGKYLTDDFGRVIYDLVEEFIDGEHIEFKEVEKEIIDEETNETRIEIELEEVKTVEKQSLGFWKHPRINPDYDPEQAYINRSDRPEWDVVGMLGKLYVRDDGTCIPNYYATIGENGIATSSLEKTNMRILSRINSNVVRVLLK